MLVLKLGGMNTERYSGMQRQQLEFGLRSSIVVPSPSLLQHRRQRARWWFQQMRQMVDEAYDWRPAPQVQSPQAHRRTEGAGAAVATDRGTRPGVAQGRSQAHLVAEPCLPDVAPAE